jgi:hypothetical protein
MYSTFIKDFWSYDHLTTQTTPFQKKNYRNYPKKITETNITTKNKRKKPLKNILQSCKIPSGQIDSGFFQCLPVLARGSPHRINPCRRHDSGVLEDGASHHLSSRPMPLDHGWPSVERVLEHVAAVLIALATSIALGGATQPATSGSVVAQREPIPLVA